MTWQWATVWRAGSGGWWRVPLTLMLYVLGMAVGLGVYTQANVMGLKQDLASQPAVIRELVPLAATLGITGLALLGLLTGVRFVHRQPVTRVFTDGRSFGWRLCLQSAAVWALLWLGFTLPCPGAWQGLRHRLGEIPPQGWPLLVVVTLAAMGVGRTAEEVLFRGYLLPRIAAWTRNPWLAAAAVVLLFSAVHRGNSAALTAITLFGISWSAASIRTGTLAPAIGAHVAHDALNVLLQPANPNANAQTGWLEVGLIAVALLLWLGWLRWAIRSRADS